MIEAQFDCDILIDALNGIERARVEIRRVRKRSISRISWIEVMAGANAESAKRVESFLSGFTVEEIGEGVSRRAATLRSERKGLTLSDAIVLASAQIAGRILITRNIRTFPAEMPGIRVPYTL